MRKVSSSLLRPDLYLYRLDLQYKDWILISSNPALAGTYTELGRGFHSRLPVALRRETPTQCPRCVGNAFKL